MNAWREILARVFAGFVERREVTPTWLVNPDTNRRLKLDVVYPEIGVAVRFSGIPNTHGPRRPSLEEERQQEVRDAARIRLCRDHGIALVQIDVSAGDLTHTLQDMRLALSDASRRLAQRRRLTADKPVLMEQLAHARSRLDDIGRRLHGLPELRVFADLWQDRQFVTASSTPQSDANRTASPPYETGMRVRHVSFGTGYVTAIRHDASGMLLTVLFEDGTERTFAAQLVDGKMSPCS